MTPEPHAPTDRDRRIPPGLPTVLGLILTALLATWWLTSPGNADASMRVLEPGEADATTEPPMAVTEAAPQPQLSVAEPPAPSPGPLAAVTGPGRRSVPDATATARSAPVEADSSRTGWILVSVRDVLGHQVPEAAVTVRRAASPLSGGPATAVAEGTTDVSGQLQIALAAGDRYLVSIDHPDFAPARPLEHVQVAADNRTTLPTFVLKIGLTLSGEVTAADQPVANATVKVAQQHPNPLILAGGFGRPRELKTDATGRFSLSHLPAGNYTCTVMAGAPWASAVADAVLQEDLPASPVQVRLQRGASVACRVVDQHGSPVADASVTLHAQNTAAQERTAIEARSAADGNVRASGLAPGAWRAQVTCPGFASLASEPFTVLDGANELEPWLVQRRPPLQVTASGPDRSRTLVTRGRIELFEVARGGALAPAPIPALDITQAASAWRLAGPGPGRYAVLVTSRDHAPSLSEPFTVPESDALVPVDVRLVAGGEVTGYVLGSDGRGLADVELMLLPDEERGRDAEPATWDGASLLLREAMTPGALRPTTRSDASGAFTFMQVAARPYRLRAAVNGHRVVAGERIEVGSRTAIGVRPFRIGAGTRVKGVAVDADDVPIRGGEVQLVRDGTTVVAYVESTRTRTDDTGMFVFDGVPPGDYSISVSRREAVDAFHSFLDHEQSRTPVQVAQGGDLQVRVHIKKNVNK